MNLVFNRPNTAEEQICDPQDVIRRGRGRSQTGAFYHNGYWNYDNDTGTIEIGFRPTIYLSNTLPPPELEQVRAHEQGHLDDFLELSSALGAEIRGAMEDGGIVTWEEMQLLWQWFNHDSCVAEGNYHRSIGQDARVCTPPEDPRPVWEEESAATE